MLPVKNQIFNVLSDSAAKTQIMVPRKQTLEELQKTDVPSAPLKGQASTNWTCTGLRALKEQAIEAILCAT